MSKTIPCTRMFCNGTEYEWFLENNCERGCTRFRNGRCRIFNACEMARFDNSKFPYDDLLEYAGGYGGMECKHYTNVPIQRKKRDNPIDGQMDLLEVKQ